MIEEFKIGQTYPQDGASLRILAFHENRVLLEKSRDGEVYQYVVTSSLCIYEDELHWSGSGEYFTPCISRCTPFEELSKAIESMKGSRKVYVMVAETCAGMCFDVHPSELSAKLAIKSACGLDSIAEVDEILADSLADTSLNEDNYFIQEYEVDFCQAKNNERTSKAIYIVLSDTDHGMSVSLQPSMQAAKGYLQTLLDGNEDVQAAAKYFGIEALTVDDYLDGALVDAPLLTDWYSIEIQEIYF